MTFRPRFSIRALLVLAALAGVLTAVALHRARRRVTFSVAGPVNILRVGDRIDVLGRGAEGVVTAAKSVEVLRLGSPKRDKRVEITISVTPRQRREIRERIRLGDALSYSMLHPSDR